MHFQIRTKNGNQRLLLLSKLRTISFFVDAVRGPVVVFVMKDGEHIVHQARPDEVMKDFMDVNFHAALADIALT